MIVACAERAALRVSVTGRVQGVGFRPFVYRLALHHGLAGSVCNLGARVEIEVCGERSGLDAFVRALLAEAPTLAEPTIAALATIEAFEADGFRIDDSRAGAGPRADSRLPPDRSLCDDCRRELSDPADRRWRHPFINCTQCGPRFTVIRGLPYDRAATSLAGFPMCAACRREYGDPLDRRFHAEPIACPDCGPRLRFVAGAREVRGDEAALAACVRALRDGAVVAVKGIGGYHLMCDATNEAAIATLRARKARPHKPLALMFAHQGADGLQMLRTELEPDDAEARALRDPARAIVLVRRRIGSRLPEAIAPGLDEIGAFLPYSPLHELLLADFGGPLVATSGNLSGEPVLSDEAEAARRLGAIADAFLHHDRPIVRPADDPVLRVIAGRPRPIRPGRGSAPLEHPLRRRLAEPVLALGGQSKITLALGFGERIVLSPHLGDLDSPRGRAVFEALVADLPRLYGVEPARLIVDRHAGFAGTRWARSQTLPVTPVAHHHAHASALAWERPEIGRWLVLAWDGVGLGDDGMLWGGEALVGAPGAWQRVGSWRPFRPPGGERAAREPWRSAAALCWECGLPFTPEIDGLAPARVAWRAGLNAPSTSAVGRLFDAAAALVLGLQRCSFEAQGPMALEAVARAGGEGQAIALPMTDDAQGLLRVDWAPLLDRLRDARRPAANRAADFHATLAEAAAAQAEALRERHGFEVVGLAGGVFQNRRLVEQLLPRLARRGLAAWLPGELPVNDGGLAFGQVVEFAAKVPQ